MYQEEVKFNPSILKRYILVGTNNFEWLVRLYEEQSFESIKFPTPEEHSLEYVVAVYKPTGRFFREKERPSWEYEYQGVRICQ